MTDGEEETRSYCPLSHPSHPDRPSQSSRTSVLCAGHVAKLQRTLEELSTFDVDADQAALDGKLARHDGAPLTGTGERPMPIDPRMADLRVDARDILAGWSRMTAEERHLSPPRRNLKALCAFLGTHLAWLTAQDWVDEFAAETFELGGKAAAILRPSGNRRFTKENVMVCAEIIDGERCPGNLWALLTPDDPYADVANELACDECGVRYTSDEWVMLGHRLRKLEAESAA